MALTNAERQALHQERKRRRMAECVTPDDVRQAIRIMFEWQKTYGDVPLTWEEWAAHCRTRKGREQWFGMTPESADPEDYPGELSSEDRMFLAKVGAVIEAAKAPPAT
jgi:hypothetical protein